MRPKSSARANLVLQKRTLSTVMSRLICLPLPSPTTCADPMTSPQNTFFMFVLSLSLSASLSLLLFSLAILSGASQSILPPMPCALLCVLIVVYSFLLPSQFSLLSESTDDSLFLVFVSLHVQIQIQISSPCLSPHFFSHPYPYPCPTCRSIIRTFSHHLSPSPCILIVA